MEVGRSLDDIDQKVKKLNESLRQASEQTRELDKAIKLDPKNIDASTKKMQLLKTQVGQATQKVTLLKQKQLEASKAFQNGDITAKEFNKIEVAVLKAENELKRYNKEIENATGSKRLQGIANINNGFGKLESTLKRTQKALRVFSGLASALVATITASITTFTRTTVALEEQAKAFDINIEKMQLLRNVYKNITGDASNYDSAMNSLKNIMTSIALGQGSAYSNILKKLGVQTKDLDGNTKSLSSIYDSILQSLSNMENETLRNSLAYELFGENAINVLEVMQTSVETIAELNEQQTALGITTEGQVETAEQIQEAWNGMKNEFMKVSAELAENLLPIIKTISEFIIKNVIPILKDISNWFANLSPEEQKFTVFLLALLILLPKVISIITAIIGVVKAITIASYGAAGGIGAVSAASVPLIPIALAVVAVILTLALLFAFLTGRSKELTNTLGKQADTMSNLETSYSNIGDDIDINTNQVSENSNTNRSEIHVDIDAHGDTQMSQENAELVADALSDRINRELGGKIWESFG